MALFTLFIIAPFVFQGGNSNEMVQTIGRHFGKPAVMLVETERVYTKHSIKGAQDMKEFGKRLDSLFGLQIADGECLGLSGRGWPGPGGFVAIQRNPRPISETLLEVKEGFVSVDCGKKGTFSVNELAMKGWSKPLKCHWFYGDYPLVASAKHVAEKPFLRALASALGARFSESDRAYSFEPDFKQYRSRVYELAKQMDAQPISENNPMEFLAHGSWRLGKVCSPFLSDAILAEAFAHPEGYSRAYDLADEANIAEAVDYKIAALKQAGKQLSGLNDLISQIDWSKRPKLIFALRNQFGLLFIHKGGGSIRL